MTFNINSRIYAYYGNGRFCYIDSGILYIQNRDTKQYYASNRNILLAVKVFNFCVAIHAHPTRYTLGITFRKVLRQ